MRLKLTANCAGELRVVSLPDMHKSLYAPPAVPRLLVSSCEFPDDRETEVEGCRVGYGTISSGTTFGKRAKSTVREVGAIADQYPKERVVFLTGTLPGSTEGAVAALARFSGWCVAVLKQWLRDHFPGALTFGVWEYQERGALHMHLCVVLETAEQAQLLMRRWKERWLKLLDGIAKKTNVDVYERADGGTWQYSKWVTRTDAQLVAKSVRCYLSKYLSKSSDHVKTNAAYPPSRWWFCDRQLLREARKQRLVLEVPLLSLFDARKLAVAVGSLIAEKCQITFAYESPVDARVKGFVGYGEPIAATELFQSITRLLRCISPERYLSALVETPPLAVASAFFDGRILGGCAAGDFG